MKRNLPSAERMRKTKDNKNHVRFTLGEGLKSALRAQAIEKYFTRFLKQS